MSARYVRIPAKIAVSRCIAAANAAGTELEAVEALCRSYAGLPAGMDYIARLDPFSREYRDAMAKRGAPKWNIGSVRDVRFWCVFGGSGRIVRSEGP